MADNEELLKEIGRLAEDQNNPQEPETKVEEQPEAKDEEPTGSEPAPADPAAETFSPDDALIERAVRAGLSITDAKAFPSAEMAERVIGALEAKAPKETTEKPKQEDGDDLSAILEEYTEENGYDPSVIKHMTTLVKKIQSLEAAGRTAAENDFFGSQFSALDEGVRSHVDAARKSQLKSKFDILEAGYRAGKVQYKREDVFREAVKLTLGDLVQKAAETSKNSALEKRKALVVAKPGGEHGRSKQTAKDDEADILAELRAKYKLN